MLTVENIVSGYGDIRVVRGISFAVDDGAIATIVGANGAGKTTTLRTMAGINRTLEGRILLDGEQIHDMPSHKRVERGLVLVPEGRRLFPSLTVMENLEMGAIQPRAKAKRKDTMAEVFGIFPVLRERAGQRAGTLSGGEQQMVAIARGLMALPRVLMLDEPSLGLAPIIVETIFEVVQRINASGVTVLMVEQNVRHCLKISSQAWVLENGEIVLSGTGEELLMDEHTRKAYLGM
ncbi:MAG: ABC transporter ATP-binding protein [Alphaproteobacteria bacterium]|nr:ABC transporter ATP-binding protein [Alphaproteobacteria bacterium]